MFVYLHQNKHAKLIKTSSNEKSKNLEKQSFNYNQVGLDSKDFGFHFNFPSVCQFFENL